MTITTTPTSTGTFTLALDHNTCEEVAYEACSSESGDSASFRTPPSTPRATRSRVAPRTPPTMGPRLARRTPPTMRLPESEAAVQFGGFTTPRIAKTMPKHILWAPRKSRRTKPFRLQLEEPMKPLPLSFDAPAPETPRATRTPVVRRLSFDTPQEDSPAACLDFGNLAPAFDSPSLERTTPVALDFYAPVALDFGAPAEDVVTDDDAAAPEGPAAFELFVPAALDFSADEEEEYVLE